MSRAGFYPQEGNDEKRIPIVDKANIISDFGNSCILLLNIY